MPIHPHEIILIFISITDGTKVRQFKETTVVPIASETDSSNRKHEMK